MSWDDLINNSYPVSIEWRYAFNDVRVTPWEFWGVETGELEQDAFESIEEAIRVVERKYGPITRTGYSNNLFAFKSDMNFQIRFITLNTQYIDAEDYLHDDYYDDGLSDDEYYDEMSHHYKKEEEKQRDNNPWRTDFDKELK